MKKPAEIALILLVLVVIGALVFTFFSQKTALIVDQLSLGFPRPEFIQKVTQVLEEADYNVIYVPNEEVTVEFFRTLPSQGADLILLRVHTSARAYNVKNEVVNDVSVSFCTGEPLSQKYPVERNTQQLGGFETEGSDTLFFSVRGDFLQNHAEGRFKKSVIVIMGCEGLRIPHTAQVLLNLGAQAVIGWTGQLSADFMDRATLFLLEHWLHNGHSLDEAVQATQRTIGTDPFYRETELRMIH